jgi:hypothetical protein
MRSTDPGRTKAGNGKWVNQVGTAFGTPGRGVPLSPDKKKYPGNADRQRLDRGP